MREILVVNPSRRKAGKKTSGRKVAKMPKKKRAGKKAPKRNPAKKTRRRTKARSYARRATRRATSGLSIKSALKDQIPIQVGMLAAQWAAKRFGPDASELDPASWGVSSYIKGAAGAFAAAMIANMIKPGMGQKILTGGLAHVTHKLVRNKLVEANPTLLAQFGEDEEGIYVDDDGTPYAASGGEYLPLDEQHRYLPSGSGMYGELEPVGPLGDSIVAAGPLGDDTGDFSRYAAAYRQ
jgi:hypothetical protein